MAAIDVSVVLVMHGLFETDGETGDSIWAVVSFVGVWPWVIRRALRKVYANAKLGIVRSGAGGSQYSDSLRYQESLKVMWLLAWRSLALSIAALLIVSSVLRFAGIRAYNFSAQGPLANNLGLSTLDAVSNLVFLPLLIPGMLKKRFRGFHLELRPVEEARVRRPR
jgi:hypothetical protein